MADLLQRIEGMTDRATPIEEPATSEPVTSPRAMPQRIGEDRIEPKGPLRVGEADRRKRILWGVGLAIAITAVLVALVLLNDPIH